MLGADNVDARVVSVFRDGFVCDALRAVDLHDNKICWYTYSVVRHKSSSMRGQILCKLNNLVIKSQTTK